ncbi:MAG TPA: hypothetical protein VJW73_01135 [Gemmatimonadaceae bacterium]|nr:hypothetical protein [Gemmatimonadaceae bacterium]
MLAIRRLSLAGAAVLLAPLAAPAQVPSGWQAVTDGSGEYSVSADVARRDGGQGYAGATIKANVASPRGSAMLAQSIRADAYRGKRVRLTGFLKTIGVNEGTAVLFMRVDGEGTVQTSDFMENRPLMLTTDWARQEIVLDIPRNAVGFTYGFMLGGSGQAWLDDVQLDVVGDDVPTTGRPGGLYPASNRNLDPREADKRRREQEVAYRRAASAPVNLALHRGEANVNAVAVAAAKNQ